MLHPNNSEMLSALITRDNQVRETGPEAESWEETLSQGQGPQACLRAQIWWRQCPPPPTKYSLKWKTHHTHVAWDLQGIWHFHHEKKEQQQKIWNRNPSHWTEVLFLKSCCRGTLLLSVTEQCSPATEYYSGCDTAWLMHANWTPCF